MSTFGTLIDGQQPLLLAFFNPQDELSSTMHPILKNVAAAMETAESGKD